MIEHYLRIYESEGTQIEPDGLIVEDPPSSLKETCTERVLNQGEDGVKLTAARLLWQGKVYLDIRDIRDIQFNALATDKNKWYAILREKQHSLMAEKYKEFRGASWKEAVWPDFS